jgi:hypothetical protein
VRHEKEGEVVTVYGNAAAASVTNAAQLPYPYGSVIVMETAKLPKGGAGKPEAFKMHVMRREKDFGRAYEANRSGEWEYVEYRPDGSYLTPPAKSAACSACHVKAGAGKDFVYQARLGGK